MLITRACIAKIQMEDIHLVHEFILTGQEQHVIVKPEKRRKQSFTYLSDKTDGNTIRDLNISTSNGESLLN